MKRIKVYLEMGLVGCRHDGTLEIDDAATEEDIEEEVRQWAMEHITFGHYEVES